MSKQQDFVKNAIAQLGKGATEFRKWYYGSDLKGVPWCAVFVSNIANLTGILGKIVTKEEGAGCFARNGVPKSWGKWYEGNTIPQPGDIVTFCWNGKGSYAGEDKYFSDHVGIVEKVSGNIVSTIEGNANGTNDGSTVCRRQYVISNNANATVINGYFRPDWSKVDSVSSTSAPKPATPTVPTNTTASTVPDIFYKVKTLGKSWLPEVKNLADYAGIRGQSITDIAIKVSKGSIKYRAHVLGGDWLPYVTGYNTSDYNNGYAGNGKIIDAIEVIYTSPSGKSYKVAYKVSPVNQNYYPEQIGNTKSSTMDGYAGSFGAAIDRVQMRVY